MLLAAGLAAFAAVWTFWFTYMVRYPKGWGARVDRHRQRLLDFGIDVPWMHRMERE